ncbi:uncharacterized protein O3C94_007933 isoform 2-T2 [Discoglossus pictus]
MWTPRIHLPTILVAENECAKDKNVTLAALVDFFMARNSNMHISRDQLQDTHQGIARYLPPRSRKLHDRVDKIVGNQLNKNTAGSWNSKVPYCEGQAFQLPLSTPINVLRIQDSSEAPQHTGQEKEDDEQSERSFKSIYSIKTINSFPQPIAKTKWTRGCGKTKQQYNQPIYSSENKRFVQQRLQTNSPVDSYSTELM